MLEGFYTFFIFGAMSLVYNSFSDFKKKVINERWNYYMSGVVITLYVTLSPLKSVLVNALVTMVIVGVLQLQKKFGVGMAKGDIQAFSWIYLGYLMYSPFFALVFTGVLAIITIAAIASLRLLYGKKVGSFPYFPIITTAFIFSNIILLSAFGG